MPNGFGPESWPKKLQQAFNRFSTHYFDEASANKHDEGYALALHSRWHCDKRFLQAMLRDASKQERVSKILICLNLAIIYWLAVRVGGSRNYGK
ncbi:MAG: hypothetical protein ABJO86_00610 [Lentilitoribacter sp.]